MTEPQTELHVYPADLAFSNEDDPGTHDAYATELGWERTLAFSKQHLSA